MPYLNKEGLTYLWGKIKTGLSGKQDKLTGIAGEVVGFDASGQAVAQPGVTMDQVNSAIQTAITGATGEAY